MWDLLLLLCSMWYLSCLTRDQTSVPCMQGGLLTTGPLGKSPFAVLIKSQVFFFFPWINTREPLIFRVLKKLILTVFSSVLAFMKSGFPEVLTLQKLYKCLLRFQLFFYWCLVSYFHELIIGEIMVLHFAVLLIIAVFYYKTSLRIVLVNITTDVIRKSLGLGKLTSLQ